jgi:metal-dependent hydrolase (beta-lactamase superfamily II)
LADLGYSTSMLKQYNARDFGINPQDLGQATLSTLHTLHQAGFDALLSAAVCATYYWVYTPKILTSPPTLHPNKSNGYLVANAKLLAVVFS